MTRSFDRFAAPYQSYGATDGEGARRLLGRPRLDPLTVFVRETIQNTWDARDPEGLGPRYDLNLRTLTGAQRDLLADVVFRDVHPDDDTGLGSVLGKDRIHVLQVTDCDTTGLGGPIRADLAPNPGESTDFIDFVFNLGAPQDTPQGGGTYGFGKTISYIVSSVATVLVLSTVRTDVSSGLETRVIGASIGHGFDHEGRRYTGRQWWGLAKNDRIEPVVGEAAEDIARELGKDPAEVGTSIVVIAPDLQKRSFRQASTFLASAITWHAWPKMMPLSEDDKPPMRVSLRLDNERVPLPTGDSRLKPFIRSLGIVRSMQMGEEAPAQVLPHKAVRVECGRPKQLLGHLAMAKAPTSLDNPGAPNPKIDACPVASGVHHVALLRQPELVVTYLLGPASSVEGFQWGGVFKTLAEVDDSFAASEPPAHDEWVADDVDDRYGATFVRVALRRIKEFAREFAAPTNPTTSGRHGRSTAEIGDALAGIIPSVGGTAATTGGGGGGSGGGGGGRKSVPVGIPEHRLMEMDGTPGVELILSVAPSRVKLDVGVLTDTGRETSPPEGSVPPRVVSAIRLDGDERPLKVIDDEFIVPAGEGGKVRVFVASPNPAALDVRASGSPLQEVG